MSTSIESRIRSAERWEAFCLKKLTEAREQVAKLRAAHGAEAPCDICGAVTSEPVARLVPGKTPDNRPVNRVMCRRCAASTPTLLRRPGALPVAAPTPDENGGAR